MVRLKQSPRTDTAERILDVAESLVQQRGFNGFSYADVAKQLGITTASLHYHYAGKEDLGKALIARYANRFMAALIDLDARFADAGDRLRGYADLYAEVLRKRKLCLCGMLAAEYQTLPRVIQKSVLKFFEDNEMWLTDVLELGRRQGSLHFKGESADEARVIVSGLQGAMLVTRPFGDVARFEAAANQLLSNLTPAN